VITARYEEKCPGCGEIIAPGDAIGFVDEEWVCESCVEDAGGEDDDT
jgi:formylmethanofuran dehydrogenase subunit E